MWVARDKDNSLWFFTDKPKRNTYTWTSRSQETQCEIPTVLFTNLKWEDEPIEVELNERKSFHFKLSEETIKTVEKETGMSIEELRRKPLFDKYELQLEARRYAEMKRPNWKDFLYQYIQDAYYDGFTKGINKLKEKLGWLS